MALLWQNDSGGWTALVLDARGAALDARGACHARGARAGDPPPVESSVAMLRRSVTAAGEEWLLLCAPGARVAVNGDPLHAGVAVLRDRDEIRLADAAGALFFAAHHAAVVETFTAAGDDPDFRCPRCRRRIEAGATIVRSRCGVVHHQSEALPCWTYAERCTVCPEPTALDDQPRWHPEEL